MSTNNQIVSKVTTDGLTKDKEYEKLSAVFHGKILILNDLLIEKFYNINLFKNID